MATPRAVHSQPYSRSTAQGFGSPAPTLALAYASPGTLYCIRRTIYHPLYAISDPTCTWLVGLTRVVKAKSHDHIF